MPFEVERTALDSGVMVLSLSGSMTMGNQIQQFEWTLQELTKKNQNRIVLDMSKITYVDSSAIGVLVWHSITRGITRANIASSSSTANGGTPSTRIET